MKHHHASASTPKSVAPTRAVEPASKSDMTSSASATASSDAKDEFVRQAAYYYYEARGCISGHELDDWLQAEAEFERLRAEDAPAGAAAKPKH